jgi:hypothetical protein
VTLAKNPCGSFDCRDEGIVLLVVVEQDMIKALAEIKHTKRKRNSTAFI